MGYIFWCFYLFQRGQQDVKDKLFNRIADSFVALFTSINPEVKDKFFQVKNTQCSDLTWLTPNKLPV